MKRTSLFRAAILAAATVCASSALAADELAKRTFSIHADRIVYDNVTKAATATGNVEAVCGPMHMRSDYATRDDRGDVHLHDPTEVTTCTNKPGICHWSVKGDVVYRNGEYVIGRNVLFEFYEIPIFWLPYFYYPLQGECALRVMPGYTDRWGAYLMTKYVYDIVGDPYHQPDTFWLYGNTRFDVRYVNGVALGQTVDWNLGSFGRGHYKIYYAWDEDCSRYDYDWNNTDHWNYSNWGSTVSRNRYAMEIEHRWEPTERDVVHLAGSLVSDSYFLSDYFRNDIYTLKNEWVTQRGNELAWEHAENPLGFGVSVAGPLNEFRGGTARLPEAYFDVAPQPIWSLPINYETENRLGYLARKYARLGDGDETNPYQQLPGIWADYATFRFDTYHRLTAPFKVADVLSVVPRTGFRGTFWNDAGKTELSGWDSAGKSNERAFRSILEGGVTFAGRGTGWVNDRWQHLMEPYLDVLAQQAWYDGIGGGYRPYVFDSLDASVDWQDQFAGRSRNLPYTYYGVTPGWRNAWNRTDDRGNLRTIVDFDIYAACQFNHAEWYGTDDLHKLAVPGSPNYGKSDLYATPGTRLRWFPSKDVVLRAQLEYDPDYNKLSYGDAEFTQRVCDDFSWYVKYMVRDYRIWDFSSTPYDPTVMESDAFNAADFQYVQLGFRQHPISWFAWNPFLRWDCRQGELDSVGAWFDYLTDCLGFRLVLEYQNAYTRIDGSEHESDVSVGFFIYLRALGAMGDSGLNDGF